MATYDDNKNYASSGVGTAGLTLGVIGTALASGIFGNGVGGLFNGNNVQTTMSQKDSYIAKLEAEKYAEEKVKELYAFQVGQGEKLNAYLQGLDKRVSAVETAAPLREQIVLGKVQEVANSVVCISNSTQTQLASITNTLASITKCVIPNSAVCPGWGEVRTSIVTAPTTAGST